MAGFVNPARERALKRARPALPGPEPPPGDPEVREPRALSRAAVKVLLRALMRVLLGAESFGESQSDSPAR